MRNEFIKNSKISKVIAFLSILFLVFFNYSFVSGEEVSVSQEASSTNNMSSEEKSPIVELKGTTENESLNEAVLSAELTNEKAGNESKNVSEPKVDTFSNTNIKNTDAFDNLGEIGINTGNNKAGYNDGDGSVKSGNADTSLGVVNLENSIIDGPIKSDITSVVSPKDNLNLNNVIKPSETIVSTNNNTGDNSENKAFLDFLNKIIFPTNTNNLINNNFPVDINTGNNTASYNDGDGNITSGNVNLSANMWNIINTVLGGNVTFGVYNIFSDYFGDIILPKTGSSAGGIIAVIDSSNTNTGNNFLNFSQNKLTNDTDFKNNSTNNLVNDFPMTINTGNNKAGYNDGSGIIETGDINVKSNVVSVIGTIFDGDNWYMVLINVLGHWAGSLFGEKSHVLFGGETTKESKNAQNSDTGDNSINKTANNIFNKADIQNLNNNFITNNMPININTGGNTASYNDGNGYITSGDANVIINLINFINSNITAKNIGLIVINIFGDWSGSVKHEEEELIKVDTTNSESNIYTIPNTAEHGTASDNLNLLRSYFANSKIQKNKVSASKIDENLPENDHNLFLGLEKENNLEGNILEAKDTGQINTQNKSSAINIIKILILISLVLLVAVLSYQKKYNKFTRERR